MLSVGCIICTAYASGLSGVPKSRVSTLLELARSIHFTHGLGSHSQELWLRPVLSGKIRLLRGVLGKGKLRRAAKKSRGTVMLIVCGCMCNVGEAIVEVGDQVEEDRVGVEALRRAEVWAYQVQLGEPWKARQGWELLSSM